MRGKNLRVHIGLRTVKTAAAVIIAMLIVNAYGTSSSKLIFAMLGAMAAVQPTFTESLEACLTQIIGVLFGAVAGVLLRYLPVPAMAICGVGIVLVITLYNALRIRYSPSLPCLILVILCVTPDIQPLKYAVGRIWDSAIGLAVGLAVNMLIFPYDNSRRIRETARSLDKELIVFLEELFDGDTVLPDAAGMTAKIDDMDSQLKIFAKQRLFLHRESQNRKMEAFRLCERKARELVARMEVLSSMERPGRLNEENRQRLADCGAEIRDPRVLDTPTEQDVVTNYHIVQILRLRQELLSALEK